MTEEPIPILDLSPEIEAQWDALNAAIQGVLRSTRFIMGPNVKAFEAELAEYLGVGHVVGVNSGTDAIVMGLRAMGVGPGDEVITSPFTFFATAEAITHLGAVPVFVDIEPDTCNLDPDRVEPSITPRTRALVPVHLFGQSADMESLNSIAAAHGLGVLEDAAQALGATCHGRRVGTLGRVGALSFFPSKPLGGFGDGGAICTDDGSLADEVRMLRTHGARKKYYNEVAGYNSRLDEIQAAVLRVKLPGLDAANAARRRAAAYYDERLEPLSGVAPLARSEWAEHVYHQYTVRIRGGKRDAIAAGLAAQGISTMVYYPVPVHRLPIYSDGGYRLPVAEAASAEVLSLPIWPGIAPEVQDRVLDLLRTQLEA